TVIIMTSNIGSRYLLEGVTPEGDIRADAREAVMAELRRGFRPEFLNRVDDIVLFKPLTQKEVGKIIELLVADLRTRLDARRLGLRLTDAAIEQIANAAYDPVYGARPLKRYLQHRLETDIGRAIIGGDILEGEEIVVDAQDGELKISHHRKEEGK
ncbi:MAG: AAA family ATPase, partial [Deltaproteobacteria bacterium]|nr:AAA family ATPase [Deltaproteobacteria bacterium]